MALNAAQQRSTDDRAERRISYSSGETQTAARRTVDYANIEGKIKFNSDKDQVNDENVVRLANVGKVHTLTGIPARLLQCRMLQWIDQCSI